ncbi:MAG: hypothetical protein A3H31_01180 [Gallionellales bacterium RIFCSPLOWO2_02_FULL_57_47]|nr:MAG: hypothetical protein A3H31_01180 [Gallionellales bacterium RIFCSPLOWO2_02_FULL_57_47]OGT18166.1 MAG: hypothetical protein A3J49_06120 [Gallionellales bacterium RIFCSPHIGHO2_02_FULL_57_16]
MHDGQHKEFVIEIAPGMRGVFGLLDLIAPQKTIIMVVRYDNLLPGRVLLVQGPGYRLEFRISSECIELTRNEYKVEVPFAHLSSRTGKFIATMTWEPKILSLSIDDRDGFREDSCKTSPTFPPPAFREWVRRQALIPNVIYESDEILYEAVLDQLQHLRDKIYDINAINGFWNIEYNGNTILSKKPKHEVDIHPQIHLLLLDLEPQKGLQVTPEHLIGSGRLDFLISGRTSANRIVKVCVEFKFAHATDLVHGIKIQLPEYMERKTTAYGIYCVLDFGSDYPAIKSKFDIPMFNNEELSLYDYLSLANVGTSQRYLNSLIIDVSKRAVPSKL